MTTLSFNDLKRLVKGMRAVYTSPQFLPDADSVKIWYKLLSDIPYERLSIAIQAYMAQGKFPPTVAELRGIVAEMDGVPASWADGWEQLQRAIRRFGCYRQEEALASMDDITRCTVRRLGWKQLCMSETPMQDRANFRMVYEQQAQKEKDAAVLPAVVRQHIGQLQGHSAAIGGAHE